MLPIFTKLINNFQTLFSVKSSLISLYIALTIPIPFIAVKEFENGQRQNPYPVKVYEKPIKEDLWTDLGLYGLIKVDFVSDGKRNIYKFRGTRNFKIRKY